VAQLVGEHGAHGAVVHFAIVVDAAGCVTSCATIVGTSGTAVEVTQVSDQLAGTQVQGVDRAQVVLLVVVLELGEVVAGYQVVAQLGITTGVLEFIHQFAAAADAQIIVGSGVTAAGLIHLAQAQGQIVDFLGGQGGAAVGLGQQATVVAHQDRQAGLQAAAELQLGLGYFGLGREVDLAELGYRTAVVIFGEHALAALIIQANARAGKYVHAEADGALGVTGLEVEHEALAPGLIVLARAFTVITVEIQVTQTQGSLGVVDKAETVIRGLGHGQSWQSQYSGGDAAGDQCSSHYVFLEYYISGVARRAVVFITAVT